MAHVTGDRVKETTTTTGTGSYTLAGAVAGFRAFSAVAANNDTVPYCCEDGTGWEVGIGTWTTGGTLARTTILASSNSNSAVNWGAGTKNIFVTLPARAATVDVQEFKTAGTSTWTKPAGAKIMHLIMHGGGGGGGSGRRRATSDTLNSQGASGGVPGVRVELWLAAASLSATETVVVGAGGAGGAAVTTDGGFGLYGTNGSASSFANWTTLGGSAGDAGSIGTGSITRSGYLLTAVTQSNTTIFTGGNAGTNGTGNGGAGGRGGLSAGAGGTGGAVVNASPTVGYTGGAGGRGGSMAFSTFPSQITGGGGTGGTASGGAGGAGAAADDPYFGGSGGGGGGNGTAQAAGAGGAGGYPGGGGGGGGASNAGHNSGAGGAGADGYVRVTTYF